MVRLDHLTITVSRCEVAKDWYVNHLQLTLLLDDPQRHIVALRDDSHFTLLLRESDAVTPSCTMAFQVDDVHASYHTLVAQGVVFDKAPQKLPWGYGAELRDPDGHVIHLWDERSMREHGGTSG